MRLMGHDGYVWPCFPFISPLFQAGHLFQTWSNQYRHTERQTDKLAPADLAVAEQSRSPQQACTAEHPDIKHCNVLALIDAPTGAGVFVSSAGKHLCGSADL